jgi:hypothetical protein
MTESRLDESDATAGKEAKEESRKPKLKRFLAFWKTGWGILVAASVIVSLASGIIFLVDYLHVDPIKIGTTGKSGPLSITPDSVTCGKTVKDLPKDVATEMPEEAKADLEQVCFVPTQMRNDSNEQLPGVLSMAILVGEQGYPYVAVSPRSVPRISPTHSSERTFIFSIPMGAAPTGLRVTSRVWVVEDGSKPKKIVYEL